MNADDNSPMARFVEQEAVKRCPFCAEVVNAAAIKCKHCGERIDSAGIKNRDGSAVMRMAGLFLFFLGAAGFVYFWQFFDTTVEVPRQEILGTVIGGQRVHNIGLMQERSSWMTGSGGAAMVGMLLMVAGKRKV